MKDRNGDDMDCRKLEGNKNFWRRDKGWSSSDDRKI